MAKLVKLKLVSSEEYVGINPIFIVDAVNGSEQNTTQLFLFTDTETPITVEGDLDTVLRRLNFGQ
jgi:hypothetical protein|nr:MAG TPA: hypothetical protein [Caudoviricetes sp.]